MNIMISAVTGVVIGCVVADAGGSIWHAIIACGTAGMAIAFAGWIK